MLAYHTRWIPGTNVSSRRARQERRAGLRSWAACPAVTGRGDPQDTTDRLDHETVTMLIDKCPQDLVRHRNACPLGSAWAKYALARHRISLALRSSRFSRSRALMRSRSSLVGPGRWLASVCWRRIQPCRVCAAQPIYGAPLSGRPLGRESFRCSEPCARHVHGLQGSRS